MLTAGTDGYVRLWSIAELLNKQRRPSTQHEKTEIPELEKPEPELEIHTGSSAIEEIDVSICGQILATVLSQSTLLWDLNDQGTKLLELPKKDGQEMIISKKFKVFIFFNLILTSIGPHSAFHRTGQKWEIHSICVGTQSADKELERNLLPWPLVFHQDDKGMPVDSL